MPGIAVISSFCHFALQDLDRYPRQLERDLELLATEGLVDLVFAPTRSEMYSPAHRWVGKRRGVRVLMNQGTGDNSGCFLLGGEGRDDLNADRCLV